MKNKNLALVAVLFTISVIMAFANGPTPQVVIDTDQIIDGAVTILKTDGVAANDLSNVTPATGRAALGLGTMAVATSTDYVATSALALRLDTTNASISNNLDVAGNVGAATLGITGHSTLTTASFTAVTANAINDVAPLTAIEKGYLLASGTFNDNRTVIATISDYITDPGVYQIHATSTTAENGGLDIYVGLFSVHGITTGNTISYLHEVYSFNQGADNSLISSGTQALSFTGSNDANLHYRLWGKKMSDIIDLRP